MGQLVLEIPREVREGIARHYELEDLDQDLRTLEIWA